MIMKCLLYETELSTERVPRFSLFSEKGYILVIDSVLTSSFKGLTYECLCSRSIAARDIRYGDLGADTSFEVL